MKRPLVKSLPLRGEISNPCSPTAVRRAKYQISNPESEMSCSAFTLAELLIAIGILGVCVAMAAALFPVAIKEHQKSIIYRKGTLTCENMMTIVKAADDRITQPFIKVPTTASAFYDPPLTSPPPVSPGPPTTDWIYDSDLGEYYPDRETGGIVFAGKMVGSLCDYRLVAMTFKKSDERNDIYAWYLDVTSVSPGKTKVSLDVDPDQIFNALVPGAVLLSAATGDYAYIKKFDGTSKVAEMEGPLNVQTGLGNIAVIFEALHDPDLSVLPRNPVMAVMSTRTGLRQ